MVSADTQPIEDLMVKEESLQDIEIKEKPQSSKQPDTEYCKLHLGNETYVVAKDFRGEILVHIREYHQSSGGRSYPTKRGIALDLEKWKKLCEWHLEDIEQAVQDYKEGKKVDLMIHLGRNIYVTLTTGHSLVHVRRWFMPEGHTKVIPTKGGITLTFAQWSKIKDCMMFMQEILGTELDAVEYCETFHHNQEHFLACDDCSPNNKRD